MSDLPRSNGPDVRKNAGGSNPLAWHRLLQSCLALAGPAPMVQSNPTPVRHTSHVHDDEDARAAESAELEGRHRRPSVLSSWLWFIGKNVIGWILILASFPLGTMLPGPGGIPVFLIGFGLVTFP